MHRPSLIPFTLILAILFMALQACTHHTPDPRLTHIEKVIEENPQKALSDIKNINPSSLDERDTHYRNLLIIKAYDKAYIRHTSDSLIREVIDYYESHQDDSKFTEVLYYGGRVYSDLGDIPTALGYLHRAIDSSSEDKSNPELRRNLFSQTGRLFERLYLNKEAIPYLQKAIEISSQLNDSAGIFYDMMQLIPLYKICDSISIAKKYQIEASRYAKALSPENLSWLNVEQTSTLLHENKIDSALSIIRATVNDVDTICRDYALVIATEIYKRAGITDTAFTYAQALALNPTSDNRLTGYSLLLSKELYPLIPKDSIEFFVQAYNKEIRANRELSQARQTMIQNSLYNYSIHVKERQTAEYEKLKAQRNNTITLFISLTFSVILILVIIYKNVKHEFTEMKLRSAIQLVQTLRYKIILQNENKTRDAWVKQLEVNPEPCKTKTQILQLSYTSTQEKLKEQLLNELKYLDDMVSPSLGSEELSNSQIVKQLQSLLSSQKVIKENMWEEIESAVLKVSPEFKATLLALTLDRMSNKEYQLALLTRCGFKPKEISVLISIGKAAVTDRRRSLSRKIFGDSYEKGALDRLISRL